MAELHSSIYVRHPNRRVHSLLGELLHAFLDEDFNAGDIAAEINPADGSEMTDDFIQQVEELRESFTPESVGKKGRYWVARMVSGSAGDYLAGKAVRYLSALDQGVRAQAWGCVDDDPWEYCFRMHNGKLVRFDCEPWMDEEEDAEIYGTIYRWWHDGMPASIREGMLSDDDEVDRNAVSEKAYQEWLARLDSEDRDEDEEAPPEPDEPPLQNDEVRELVGALSELFSSFGRGRKVGDDPQSNALKANALDRDLVMRGLEDMNRAENEGDLANVLKHLSPDLVGRATHASPELGDDTDFTYQLLKMGLGMLIKPGIHYQSQSEVRDLEIRDDGSAELFLRTNCEYTEPMSREIYRSVSDDRQVWKILDGRLQVVEISNHVLENGPVDKPA